MLDLFSGLKAAVRERVEESAPHGLGEVNARLHELFAGFKLETREDGEAIWPLMRPEVWEGRLVELEPTQDEGVYAVHRFQHPPQVEALETARNTQT